MRDPDAARWTVAELLLDVRRDRAISLGRSPLYSPMGRCDPRTLIEQQLWRDPFEEPAWFYDLDHAVREALRLHGRVPILAARSLGRQDPSAFSLTPDFELIRRGEDKPTVEIDLGVISDGQIILCEAKSCDTLASDDRDEKRDAAKFILACRVMTADILCLATTEPKWSSRTRATVQAAYDQAEVCALWLERLGAPPVASAPPSE
jgi:hypothetical protein